MRKLFKWTAAALLLSSLFTACASLTSADEQTISITTDCKGRKLPTACVATNGTQTFSFNTPATIKVKRNPKDIQITCQGGLLGDSASKTAASIGLPFYGNILIGGGLGAMADIQSNKIFEYPSAINVEPAICKYF